MSRIDFGYLFCRTLSEYGFSFDELMNTTIRRFWFLSNTVDRLQAERDLRQVQLLAAADSAESFKAATESLNKTVGQIYVVDQEAPKELKVNELGLDPEFDREGLQKLKRRIAAGR